MASSLWDSAMSTVFHRAPRPTHGASTLSVPAHAASTSSLENEPDIGPGWTQVGPVDLAQVRDLARMRASRAVAGKIRHTVVTI